MSACACREKSFRFSGVTPDPRITGSWGVAVRALVTSDREADWPVEEPVMIRPSDRNNSAAWHVSANETSLVIWCELYTVDKKETKEFFWNKKRKKKFHKKMFLSTFICFPISWSWIYKELVDYLTNCSSFWDLFNSKRVTKVFQIRTDWEKKFKL